MPFNVQCGECKEYFETDRIPAECPFCHRKKQKHVVPRGDQAQYLGDIAIFKSKKTNFNVGAP
jgi:Zn finger protein HypA/HybF involved in hydrogenase expression